METPRGMEADIRNNLFADHSSIHPWIGGDHCKPSIRTLWTTVTPFAGNGVGKIPMDLIQDLYVKQMIRSIRLSWNSRLEHILAIELHWDRSEQPTSWNFFGWLPLWGLA